MEGDDEVAGKVGANMSDGVKLSRKQVTAIRRAVIAELFEDRKGLKLAWGEVPGWVRPEVYRAVEKRIRKAANGV